MTDTNKTDYQRMLEFLESINVTPFYAGAVAKDQDKVEPAQASYLIQIRNVDVVIDYFDSNKAYLGKKELLTFSKVSFAERLNELKARLKE